MFWRKLISIIVKRNRHVEEKKFQNTEHTTQFIELLSSNNPAEISLIQSVLGSEKIIYHLSGGNMVSAGALSGGSPARFYVAKPDYEKAKRIVNDLKWNNS